jgi:hypothetical protein
MTVAGVMTGCTGGDASTTPTVRLAPTSTPITTEPTTGEPTGSETVAGDSGPTTDPQIAEIEAAVAAARDVQVEVLTDPSMPVDRMEEVATGRALAATVENTLKSRAEGRTFVGHFVRRPIETTITGSTAIHLECGVDALAAFSANGELLVPADEAAVLRRYDLLLIDGDWVVELVGFEGSEKQSCVL